MKKFLCLINIVAFLTAITPMTLKAEYGEFPVSLGNTNYNLTMQQLRKVKSQRGISFLRELPRILPSPLIAVTIPEELGGGYLMGTEENVAKAFNAAGITVGLTASAISRSTNIVGGIVLVTLVGLLAASLGDSSTTHTHSSP